MKRVTSRHAIACIYQKAKSANRSTRYGLRAINYPIAGADQRIRAIIAEGTLAQHLDIADGSACFQVQCTGFTGLEPLWWERTTYRGDAYELISRIGNQDDGQPVRGVLR